ncbi:ArnT family glycosyltransferase [Stratiformator vulcanicus]|uniref:Dolichyl-phosphate-mannose-protein mannosyltransferase n=1 Tax=Stratiformator vulcanicus TaxID=2527980 RepID=A0A517R495_9PLAN|nr:glycosyltransferase family 39 protein [Stratiformator vulcanicus]QDT38712.1 Dolichyl-phosphate-mannose-protein mannosyltransferase [Stratiformator vulcanicus]
MPRSPRNSGGRRKSRENSPTPDAVVRDRPSRSEVLLVLALTLCGIAIRLAFPGRMAIEHYDEGIYASNIFFGPDQGGTHPALGLHAPPVVPFLIEMSFVLFGISDFAAMLPAILIGSLTVPLVWKVGRDWFGPGAGLISAGLIATSDIHVLYSRTALTDVPAAFFLIAGTWAVWKALVVPSARSVLVAAVLIALGWSTKYTGWLPIAIGWSGAIGYYVVESNLRKSSWRPSLISMAAVTALAIVCWLPTLYWTQRFGGMSAVSGNQAGYVVAYSQWVVTWAAQVVNQSVLESSVSRFAICASVLAAVVIVPGTRWRIASALAVGCGLLIFVIATGVTAALFLIVVGVFGSVCQLAFPSSKEIQRSESAAVTTGSGTPPERLASWMLLAWLCGLILAVGRYTPYPRLILPLLCAAWLAAGPTFIAVGRVLTRCGDRWSTAKLFAFGGSALVLAAVGFAVIPTTNHLPLAVALQDRTGTRLAAEKVIADCDGLLAASQGSVDYVIATRSDPALYFHLMCSTRNRPDVLIGLSPISAVERVAARGVPAYFARGIHSSQETALTSELTKAGAAAVNLPKIDCSISSFVALNYEPGLRDPDRQGTVSLLKFPQSP